MDQLHEWVCSFDDPSLTATAFSVYEDRKIVGAEVIDYLKSNGAESGESLLILADTVNIQDETVEIALDEVISLEVYEDPEVVSADEIGVRRRLVPSIGTLNTLVVRVNALDNNPPSATALSSDVFYDPVNLKSQSAATIFLSFEITTSTILVVIIFLR